MKNVNDKYLGMFKKAVADYFNKHADETNRCITLDDIFIVWFSKTLQNAKGLLSTTIHDGMYYELTYNGDKDELYLDVYKKRENVPVKHPFDTYEVQ